MEPTSSLWTALTRERNIKVFTKAKHIFESFSITEKAIFLACAVIFTWSVLVLVGSVSEMFSVNVPRHGGTLVEGVVGTPRFINPLLAVSDADRDLSALVYSGLLKNSPDGALLPDLAQSYSVSPDGLVYTITIRADAKFHDGTPVTSDDVEFTVQKVQDVALKSPRHVSWEGVTFEKTGDHSLTFTLKQPYAPFIANLTLGILPAHIWKSLTSDQFPFSGENINPVGSGPYKVTSIEKSASGIPTEALLKANPEYVDGEPFITNILIKFFSNDQALADALASGDIDSASNLSPATASALRSKGTLDRGTSSDTILSAPLTRVFGIFFDQNENEILAHKEIRKALSLSVDRRDIIESVLQGFGTEADGPLPPTVADKISLTNGVMADKVDFASSTLAAQTLLAKAGWKKNPATGILELKGKTKGSASTTLAFSISTANIPELVMSAKKIVDSWTALGAKVDLRVFEPSDLNQGVIRPRKYDALLFGLVTGRNSDLYPFWHSSQRNDPGLNIALYTNQKADKLLEKMRQATSSAALASEYIDLKKEIVNDAPAIFLWSPDFIYAVPEKLRGISLGEITTPSDRFIGVEHWYVETDHVWDIFVHDKDSIVEK